MVDTLEAIQTFYSNIACWNQNVWFQLELILLISNPSRLSGNYFLIMHRIE